MSIIVDDREGSLLVEHLTRMSMPAWKARLDYGDIAIQASNGWLIGMERKRIGGLVADMQSRRLAGLQLRGMYQTYDRVELIIEGIWKPGQEGEIRVINAQGKWVPLFHRSESFLYRNIDSYIYSLTECGGVYVWRTSDSWETANLVASRWHWWQKDYHAHKSVDVLFANEPAAQRRGAVMVHHGDPNPVTIVAAQAPNIDSKAWDVGEQFGSIREMANADERDWRQITWTDRSSNVKHFGPDTSREIVDWFWGRKVGRKAASNGQKA